MFLNLKWTHLSKASKHSPLVHDKSLRHCPVCLSTIPQLNRLPFIILWQNQSWWSCALLMQPVSQKALGKISHLHYNFWLRLWAAGCDLIRLFMLHNACLSLAGQAMATLQCAHEQELLVMDKRERQRPTEPTRPRCEPVPALLRLKVWCTH